MAKKRQQRSQQARATQLEHDRIDGHHTLAWTESFGAVDLDPDACIAEHSRAAAHARDAVLAAAPPELLRRRHHGWLAEVADTPVDETLSVGSGWGAVELRLRGGQARIPAGLHFPDVDDDSRTTYLRSALPSFSGVSHAMVRLPSPRVTMRTPVTARGRVSGRTVLLGALGGLWPTPFTATTVKV